MNRRIVSYLLTLVVVGVVFSFCSRPKEVLSRKEMEKLMYDVYMAEALIDNDYQRFDTPEKKEALISEVFKKHKTTQAQWDTSLSWYSDRIDVYLVMNDSVKARLQRKQKSLEQIVNRQIQQEQSFSSRIYSISHIPQNYSFDEIYPKNGFRFRLDSIEIQKRISSSDFDFSFKVFGIPENSVPNLRTMLMLEYKDTTIYRSEFIHSNRSYLLHANKYILNDTLRSINGFVRLQDTTATYKGIIFTNIFLGNPVDTVSEKPENPPLPENINLMEKEADPQ